MGVSAHQVLRKTTLAGLLTFALVPILWMVLTSFKTRTQVFADPPLFVFSPSFTSWQRLVEPGPIRHAFVNSFNTAFCTMIVTLILACLAAYAFSRLSFRGKGVLLLGILASRLIPPINGVVPLFLLFNQLKLIDTTTGLVILYVALLVPLAIVLVLAAIEGVPKELEEAAMSDGCGRFGAFRHITAPLAAPGLAVAAIFVFILSWNEFMFAYIFTSVDAITTPVLIAKAVGEYGVAWADLCAQATALLVPVFIVTVFLQRRMISGLSAGALD